MQTVFNGLPIRGGERVLIKIAGNSKVNKDGLVFQIDHQDIFTLDQ